MIKVTYEDCISLENHKGVSTTRRSSWRGYHRGIRVILSRIIGFEILGIEFIHAISGYWGKLNHLGFLKFINVIKAVITTGTKVTCVRTPKFPEKLVLRFVVI